VWAVGFASEPSGDHIERTLIERWDGTQWSVAPSPNPYREDQLVSVASSPDGQAWAVGVGFDGRFHTLAEHWGPTGWTVEATADPGTTDNYLNAVALLPGLDRAIAVGLMKGPSRTLIEWSC
jgi:hypothetical protein